MVLGNLKQSNFLRNYQTEIFCVITTSLCFLFFAAVDFLAICVIEEIYIWYLTLLNIKHK